MKLLLILKGIIIGIGKIIPGVSGSVMAISLGVYDKTIYSITHFFDDVKNNLKYLLFLGLGIILGIVLFSKILLFLLNSYYFYTMMFLIGLITGGIFTIYKSCDKSKLGIFLIILGFIFMGIFSILSSNNQYIIKGNYIDILVFIFSGFLEGMGTIIPGVSSTALLMIIGMYEIFMTSISNVFNISYVLSNLSFYLSFSLGLFISIFLSIYLIQYLFSKYKNKTFSFILGIILSNILFLFIKVFQSGVVKNLIIGIILLGIGIIISLLTDT